MRIGSLFSGYGGLDMAVAAHYCATVAWHCEFDKHPSAILAHHYPDIPNHHDVTSVDWAAVEPVDILTGGFPCQDVSHAGVRAGIRPGTRSGLWEHFDYAISILKPRLVVIENVSGLLSADAHCDVEPCPWCVGDEPDGHMRALGAVLADLAEAGFDAEWCSVRASDVGAPHRRERVFIVAADAGGETVGQRPGLRTGEPGGIGRGRPDNCGAQAPDRLMPTPVARDSKGRMLNSRQGGDSLPDAALNLLPTPNGNGHGKSLEIEARRLLPTPRATDGTKGGPNQAGSSGDLMLPSAVQPDRFGPYAAAIHSWEQVLGRPAPPPTEPGMYGRPRLSPRFVEHMMGLPDGWVTGVDIPRSAQLKALGNGVVKQQAALALALLDGAS